MLRSACPRGAADIFANTGGVMEAALRTVYEIVTGRQLPVENLHVASVAGLERVKEASLTIEQTLPEWSFLEGVTLNVAVAHGLANAEQVIEAVRPGESQYHFVEVMTCPGGCIGGGGQPRFTDDRVRQARIAAIYQEDEGKTLRKSHENPAVAELYESSSANRSANDRTTCCTRSTRCGVRCRGRVGLLRSQLRYLGVS